MIVSSENLINNTVTILDEIFDQIYLGIWKKSSRELSKHRLRLFWAHISYKISLIPWVCFIEGKECQSTEQCGNFDRTLIPVLLYIYREQWEGENRTTRLTSLSARVRIYPSDRPYEFHLACHRISFSVHIVYETRQEEIERKKIIYCPLTVSDKPCRMKNINNYENIKCINKNFIFICQYIIYKFYMLFL